MDILKQRMKNVFIVVQKNMVVSDVTNVVMKEIILYAKNAILILFWEILILLIAIVLLMILNHLYYQKQANALIVTSNFQMHVINVN